MPARQTEETEEGELVAVGCPDTLALSSCFRFTIFLVILPAPALFQERFGEVVEKIAPEVGKPEFFFCSVCWALADPWAIQKLCQFPNQ